MAAATVNATVTALVSALVAGETTADKIKDGVRAGKIDQFDAMDALQAFAQRSAAAPVRALSCKVSEKGALSLYGLNARFPVTLYAEQWERVIGFVPELQAFIKANAKGLSRK